MSVLRVTVAMPVFNEERYLAAALEAILAQSYPHLEVVISDNASTDQTARIAMAYAQRDARIRFTQTPTFLTWLDNWRRCLSLASGEFFMWAAADDRHEPTFIADILRGFTAETVTGFCQLDKVNVDDGTVLSRFRQPPLFAPGASLAANQILYLSQPCYWMIYGIHRTAAVRAAMALDQDVTYPFYIDYVLPFRILGLGSPSIVRKVLFHSGKRAYQQSKVHKRMTKPEKLEGRQRFLEAILRAIQDQTHATDLDKAAMTRTVLESRDRKRAGRAAAKLAKEAVRLKKTAERAAAKLAAKDAARIKKAADKARLRTLAAARPCGAEWMTMDPDEEPYTDD